MVLVPLGRFTYDPMIYMICSTSRLLIQASQVCMPIHVVRNGGQFVEQHRCCCLHPLLPVDPCHGTSVSHHPPRALTQTQPPLAPQAQSLLLLPAPPHPQQASPQVCMEGMHLVHSALARALPPPSHPPPLYLTAHACRCSQHSHV